MSIELFSYLFGVAAIFVGAGLRWVPEGTVCTVHRFGRYVRALPPGLNWTLPLIDQIARRINLVGHHVELELPEAGQQASVYFQILEPIRAGAALEDVDALVERLARERVSKLTAPAAAEPKAFAQRLKDELNLRLTTIGLHVTRCQLL